MSSIRENWDRFWKEYQPGTWDEMSEALLQALVTATGSVAGLRMLEAGSGSGRVSMRLAKLGAKVTLLDYSELALETSKKAFSESGLTADFVNGQIEKMPFPDEAFDVVWNAGVLEHYDFRGQLQLLGEMARVCRNGGLLITINPYAGDLLYLAGKWWLERTGKWAFGFEQPVKTLVEHVKYLPLRLDKEYTVGAIDSLAFLAQLPFGEQVSKYLELSYRLMPPEDRVHVGGRFLASVFEVDRSLRQATDTYRGSAAEVVPSPTVICLSSIDWHFLWQRPQQIMSRLARKGWRVVFVNSTGRQLVLPSAEAFLRERRNIIVSQLVSSYVPVDENLFVVNLPFAVSDAAGTFSIDVRAESVGYLAQLFTNGGPMICWTLSPLWNDVCVSYRSEMQIVYDCVDDHASFTGAPVEMSELEQELFRSAHVVITTSRPLAEKAAKHSERVYLIPNGVDAGDFQKQTVVPRDLAELPAPRIGFSGAIGSWVARDILATLARKHPEWSIIIVGQALLDVSGLMALPNIHFLGTKDYLSLPSYLHAFDVGLVPFQKESPVVRNSNPIKLYEYLMAGLPVVSTYWPELEMFRDIVYFASDGEQFCAQVERALAEKDANRIMQGMRKAAEFSWETLTDVIVAVLLGNMALMGREFAAAAKHFQRGSELWPVETQLIRDQGLLAFLLGDMELARRSFSQAGGGSDNKRLASEYLRAALGAQSIGQREAVHTLLSHALSLDPDNADVHVNCGLLALETADSSTAVRELAEAIILAPANDRVYGLLASVLSAQGANEAALTLLDVSENGIRKDEAFEIVKRLLSGFRESKVKDQDRQLLGLRSCGDTQKP